MSVELNFSKLIPFGNFPDGHDIDDGSYGFTGDLAKGGIYMAFAVSEIQGQINVEKLLYIGKAETPNNTLGKRINEHGQVLTGQKMFDHSRWRQNNDVENFQKIAYCYAYMDDMSDISDIEYKLIWLNQPPCNEKGKASDCSSDNCPSIRLQFPFNCNVKGYINTLMDHLKRSLNPKGIK